MHPKPPAGTLKVTCVTGSIELPVSATESPADEDDTQPLKGLHAGDRDGASCSVNMDSSIKAVLSPPAQEGRSVFSLDAAKNLISIAKESNWRQERRAERGLWRRLWQSEERISAESHFGSEEESPIDRQSIQHQSQPPWSIICNQQKPLSALQAFARENPTAIRTATGFARDAAGATVLHIAVLNARLEMINYLIDKYGAELVQLGYDSWGPEVGGFDGETALHMVIAKWSQELTALGQAEGEAEREEHLRTARHWRDLMAKVINTVPQLLQARAVGFFFARGGESYYGELPLLWAASFGHEEIVEMLLSGEELHEHADILEDRDQHGNTALHMAVHHSLHDMYSLLLARTRAAAETQVLKQRLCLRAMVAPQNMDGLSPLSLAVDHNDSAMFQHICSHERAELWKFGPVTCCMIPLDEIDLYCSSSYLNDHQRSDTRVCSALAVAASHGHAEILEHAFITKMLREKWRTSAAWHFYTTAAAYFALMVVVSCLVSVRISRGEGQVGAGEKARAANERALEMAAVVGASAFGALDLYDRFRYLYVEWRHYVWVQRRWAHACPGSHRRSLRRADSLNDPYMGQGGIPFYVLHRLRSANWGDPFTMCKHLTALLELSLWGFIVCAWIHVLRGSHHGGTALPLALAALFGWLYMLYFARGWQALGHLVVTIGYMTTDVLKFMLIYTIISIAYAEALVLLIEEECVQGEECPCQTPEGCNLWYAWLSLLSFSIGAVSEQFFYTIKTPIYLTFSLISNVLMLNLLIALMNNTFDGVSREADKIWMRQWAHYILRVERRLPRGQRQRLRLGMPDQDTRVRRHFARQLYMQDVVSWDQAPEEIVKSASVAVRAGEANLLTISSGVSLPELLKEPERYQYVWYETDKMCGAATPCTSASEASKVGDPEVSVPSAAEARGLFKTASARYVKPARPQPRVGDGVISTMSDFAAGEPAGSSHGGKLARMESLPRHGVDMQQRPKSRRLGKVITFKKVG